MTAYTKLETLCIFLLLLSFALPSLAEQQCQSKSGGCYDKAASLKLKFIAICSILVTSMIGVCLPMFTHAVPALQADKDLFMIVKAFASGVILATGYMHVLPDSFDDLRSLCLPEKPWRKFPFTTFVAMLSAVVTLMVDSLAMSYYKKYCSKISGEGRISDRVEHGHFKIEEGKDDMGSQLLRHRVVAQVYMAFPTQSFSLTISSFIGVTRIRCQIFNAGARAGNYSAFRSDRSGNGSFR